MSAPTCCQWGCPQCVGAHSEAESLRAELAQVRQELAALQALHGVTEARLRDSQRWAGWWRKGMKARAVAVATLSADLDTERSLRRKSEKALLRWRSYAVDGRNTANGALHNSRGWKRGARALVAAVDALFFGRERRP